MPFNLEMQLFKSIRQTKATDNKFDSSKDLNWCITRNTSLAVLNKKVNLSEGFYGVIIA